MKEISKYIVNLMGEKIREDKGKLYFLTGFSHHILLEIYRQVKQSDYFKAEKWRVFLMQPPKGNSDVLSKRLGPHYLEVAVSPDFAAGYRDTDKVIYLYPLFISQIISETISLNTALNLSLLYVSPEKCLFGHLDEIINKKGRNGNDQEREVIKEMIEGTFPSVDNEDEFEDFYSALLKVLESGDYSDKEEIKKGTIKLCKLCGLLPDPDIEKCLSDSTSRGELTKEIKVNNKVFKQVINDWNNNKKDLLAKLSDFNSDKAKKFKEYMVSLDIELLVPYEKSVRKKRTLIEGWPRDCNVKFLRLQGDSDFILEWTLENTDDWLFKRYIICSPQSKVKIRVKRSVSDDEDGHADVTIRLNNDQYRRVEKIIDDYEDEFELSGLMAKCKAHTLTEPPQNFADFNPGSVINKLDVKISGSNVEADDDSKYLIIHEDRNKPCLFMS